MNLNVLTQTSTALKLHNILIFVVPKSWSQTYSSSQL